MLRLVLTSLTVGALFSPQVVDAQIWSQSPAGSAGIDITGGNWWADSFVLSDPTTVFLFRVWTHLPEEQPRETSWPGSLSLALYSDLSGEPGSAISGPWTTPTTDVEDQGVFNLFRHDFAVSVPLSAATYWLVMHNPTAVEPHFWAVHGFEGGQAIHRPPGETDWYAPEAQYRRSLAFEVYGETSVVPEPSTWVLLATGLVGIGIVARRRKDEDEV